MSATQYAIISDRAVMFASLVYALALVAHVAEWAALRRAPVSVGGPAVEVERRRTLTVPGRLGSDSAGGERVQALALDSDAAAGPVSSASGERAGRIAMALTIVAFGLHLTAVVARGLAAGRVPWGNMYEFALAGTFGAVGFYLVLAKPLRLRWLGLPLLTLVVTILMASNLTLYVPAGPLVPALHSYWLVIHVTAAIVAVGAFTVGALASLLYLIKDHAQRAAPAQQAAVTAAGTPSGSVLTAPRTLGLPSLEAMDAVIYRIHAFAFPIWTFAALIAGPIWAKYAWGRYWGWDPKEIWAFITWVVYAAYLHARATAGWRGRKAATLALVGYVTVLFNFIGINIFGSGLHSYAGL